MKLQLATDVLRLRLTTAEFARLRAGDAVEARLPLPHRAPFEMRVESGDVFAVPEGTGLRLRLPSADLAALDARLPCRDGLEYVANGPTGPVRIVVEVDIRDGRRTTR
ncbi:hypothetical protein [Lysobacter humi (ex Lee et al. 2017)]